MKISRRVVALCVLLFACAVFAAAFSPAPEALAQAESTPTPDPAAPVPPQGDGGGGGMEAQIIGGTLAGAGNYPWQVAIIFPGAPSPALFNGQFLRDDNNNRIADVAEFDAGEGATPPALIVQYIQ